MNLLDIFSGGGGSSLAGTGSNAPPLPPRIPGAVSQTPNGYGTNDYNSPYRTGVSSYSSPYGYSGYGGGYLGSSGYGTSYGGYGNSYGGYGGYGGYNSYGSYGRSFGGGPVDNR